MSNNKLKRIIPIVIGGVTVLTIGSIVLGSLLGTQSSKKKAASVSLGSEGIPSLLGEVEEVYDPNFIIKTKQCKVPRLEPTSIKNTKELFPLQKVRLTCQLQELLTRLEVLGNGGIKVQIDDEAIKNKKKDPSKVSCCYRNIKRSDDDGITDAGECKKFVNGQEFPDLKDARYVYAECKDNGKVIYSNVHSAVVPIVPTQKKPRRASMKNPPKVVLFGMAGASAMSFERLIKTREMIKKDDHWIQMKGFTKSSNKFDTLYIMLTGRSPDESYKDCNPKVSSFLDKCNFIWKDYQNAGYFTFFGEEQVAQSTFNKNHKGFKDPPTHYYFRPAALAIEKYLEKRQKHKDNLVCVGPFSYFEHLFIFHEKVISFNPVFGVMYTNSFNTLHLGSAPLMDVKLSSYLLNAVENSWDNTIVIFFSDAGLRYEKSDSKGFFEERLPFLFIRIPDQIKKEYPGLVGTLKQNTNKLISPYDVHLFLRHILKLSVPTTQLTAEGCATCHSLFEPIPSDRSCSQAKIPQKSCPCMLDNLKVGIPQDGINQVMKDLGKKCDTPMELEEVKSVEAIHYDAWNLNYLVKFKTKNSKTDSEVLLRRKPFSIFSSPKFEVLASNNLNETICEKNRPEIMAKIIQHVFEEFNYFDYVDYEYP